LPILATRVKAEAEKLEAATGDKHHSVLLKLLAQQLQCQVSEIETFELSVADCQGAVIGGICNEFIFSARLDNLLMSFCATTSLLESLDSLKAEANVRMIVLFDNEEIGSRSAYGAMGPFLNDTINRIVSPSGSNGLQSLNQLTVRNSFLISADMAHGIHPNYSSKHEYNHAPMIHKGPVIKYNAEQRYATTSETAFVLLHLAKLSNIPIQEFVVRNDSPCGSTIGPILASGLGIRTVDMGNAQLSMHSIREMCGVDDVNHTINLFTAFYNSFTELDKSLNCT